MAASTHPVRAIAGATLPVAAATVRGNDVSIDDDDGKSNVGLHASIAIGGDHRPIISCHDAFPGSLKIVHCRARSCDGVFRDDFDQGVSP